jgi:hypothetical protein
MRISRASVGRDYLQLLSSYLTSLLLDASFLRCYTLRGLHSAVVLYLLKSSWPPHDKFKVGLRRSTSGSSCLMDKKINPACVSTTTHCLPGGGTQYTGIFFFHPTLDSGALRRSPRFPWYFIRFLAKFLAVQTFDISPHLTFCVKDFTFPFIRGSRLPVRVSFTWNNLIHSAA